MSHLGKVHECDDPKSVACIEKWLEQNSLEIERDGALNLSKAKDFFTSGETILVTSFWVRRGNKEVFLVNVLKDKSLADIFVKNANRMWHNQRFFLVEYCDLKDKFPDVKDMFPPERFGLTKEK